MYKRQSLANVYENSRSKNSEYAKYASRYIQDIANHHLELISGLFHAETVTRDIMLEVQEIDHLTEMIYNQAQMELDQVNQFINHITERRTVAQSFIYKAEWNRIRQDKDIPANFKESLTQQLNKVIPTLVFSRNQYQIHYKVAILKEGATFSLANSKHVSFNTNIGQLILDHTSTSQLTSTTNSETFIIPSEQLRLCTTEQNTLYCSADVLKTGLDPCITAIMGNTPDNILSQCTLQPARRRNTALRLTPAMIYYDQNNTRATQTCGTRHTFNLEGQGIFIIPPTCSLSFNNAIFRNTDKKKINHHQQQQQVTPLAFSDQAIMDNEIDFPEQRQSFVTTQESMISHALLLLLIACLLYTSPSPRD